MAESPERHPWENPGDEAPRTPSVGVYNHPHPGTGQADESPELLRWRADSLLDEMMLGAVDVSAADVSPPDLSAPGMTESMTETSAGAAAEMHGERYHDESYRPSDPYRDPQRDNRYDQDRYPEEWYGQSYGSRDVRNRAEQNGGWNGDHRSAGDRYNGHNGYDGPGAHTAYTGYSGGDGQNGQHPGGYNGEPFRSQEDARSGSLLDSAHDPAPQDRASHERGHGSDDPPSLPPLSMQDPGPHGLGFEWREELRGTNGNGAYGSAHGPGDGFGPVERSERSGTADTAENGWRPPTIPPPRDGGRPAIRSGGVGDGAPRSVMGADFSGSVSSILPPIKGSPPAPGSNGGGTLSSGTLSGGSVSSASIPGASISSGPRVYAAEQRYEQFAAQQRTAQPEVSSPPPEHLKWEWQDFSRPSQPDPVEELLTGGGGAASSPGLSDAAQYVNAMSVPVGRKRSTLLPRMTNVDADAVNQEIVTLHAEIGRLLPNGHEAGERARHLLEKAHSILQSDPMREAEVEYYMQQVRSIVQRVQQTRRWSDLYRDRLRLYLSAWLFLSLIVVTARVMFPIDVEAFLVGVSGGALGSALLVHYLGGLTATFAGSLGSAVGALVTMLQHARREYGFFDRKYGLRGLMLPIIGWFFGALLYLVAALIFSLMGIVPAENAIAAAIPAVGAFLFGVSQESIYGTRS